MIERTYMDAFDEEHSVPESTIRSLEEAMGEPTDEGPLIVHPGDTSRVRAEVILEDGTVLPRADHLPPDLPLGYHRLRADDEERDLIVSPGRCHLPSGRMWGWATQLYAARSSLSWGMGDLADLRLIGERAAGLGAGMVLVNPLLAVAPTRPQNPSPYFPASRRFLNPIYLRVEDVPGAGTAGETLIQAAAAGQALGERPTIDRDRVWRLKSDVLERIWKTAPPDQDFEWWREAQGAALEEFAAWCVLAERHGRNWSRWPSGLSRPETAVPLVRSEHGDRLRYHQWLQWLCRRQLDDASTPVMLMQDLPIGVDPGGADAWAWQDLMALGVSVGAPPDEFNTLGQDWGLPPFIPHRLRAAGYRPFVETIRASLQTGGGMRIDHVMGLFRLFCIPPGARPADGGYVRFPASDLLDIVALESVRARAVVVGEDLGTVEEGVREEMADRRMLSYRLLWFEADDPARWPELSMASVTTHDLPTVIGLWSGSDLEEQRRLDLSPNEESTEKICSHVADLTGLDESETPEQVVAGVHRQLSRSPSRLLCATLEDVALTGDRPNMPGAHHRANWSIALPRPVEDLMSSPLAGELATIFNGAMDEERR